MMENGCKNIEQTFRTKLNHKTINMSKTNHVFGMNETDSKKKKKKKRKKNVYEFKNE